MIYDFLLHEFSTYPCAVSSSLESFAFFGVVINLVTYLVEEMHFGVPTAANTVTTWAGTTCLTPLLGGFIADTYLGRYLTLLFLGFVQLLVNCFHPPCVCPVSCTSLHTIRTRSSSLIDKSSPIAETWKSSFEFNSFSSRFTWQNLPNSSTRTPCYCDCFQTVGSAKWCGAFAGIYTTHNLSSSTFTETTSSWCCDWTFNSQQGS